VKAGALVEVASGRARVAPDARGAVLACVFDERFEHSAAKTAPARRGDGCHRAHAPRPGRAFGRDEADGEQLIAVERPRRVSAGRLLRGEPLEAFVPAQNRLTQDARPLDRDLDRARQSASIVARNVRPRFSRIGTASSST
jgi:hypothetical protein